MRDDPRSTSQLSQCRPRGKCGWGDLLRNQSHVARSVRRVAFNRKTVGPAFLQVVQLLAPPVLRYHDPIDCKRVCRIELSVFCNSSFVMNHIGIRTSLDAEQWTIRCDIRPACSNRQIEEDQDGWHEFIPGEIPCGEISSTDQRQGILRGRQMWISERPLARECKDVHLELIKDAGPGNRASEI